MYKVRWRKHFEATYTAPTRKVYSLMDESIDDSDAEYITSIVAQPEMIHAVTQQHYPKGIYTEMFVDKKEVKFQVDSGASLNVIPVNKKLEPTTKTLQMWNDTKPKATGFLSINSPQFKEQENVFGGIPCR